MQICEAERVQSRAQSAAGAEPVEGRALLASARLVPWLALLRAVLGQVWVDSGNSCPRPFPPQSAVSSSLLSCGCSGGAQGRCCSVVLSSDSVLGLANVFFLLVTLI